MIHARELTKQYGDKTALDRASFDIEEGQVVGLLGLNGAGKSTTMNILTGYISATGGTVTIDGHDISTNPRQAKQVIGYLPEQPAFYPEMKVRDHLNFICGLKNVTAKRREHIDDICRMVGLADMQSRMVRNLSKGYRQRLGFAQALIGNPKVVILDEPTVGLDPSQIIDIRQLIKDSGQRGTVIVSSHILPEIQAVCNRIIMLQKGRVVADCHPDDLAGKLALGSKLRVRIQGEASQIETVLKEIPEVQSLKHLGQNEAGAWDFALESAANADMRPPVFRALATADMPLLSAHGVDASLEEAFLSMVTDTTGEEASQ